MFETRVPFVPSELVKEWTFLSAAVAMVLFRGLQGGVRMLV